MIFLDPVYVMVFLLLGVIGFIAVMFWLMRKMNTNLELSNKNQVLMNKVLEGILNETRDTSGHLRSLYARSVSSTVGRSVGGLLADQRFDPDATVEIVRVSPGESQPTGRWEQLPAYRSR